MFGLECGNGRISVSLLLREISYFILFANNCYYFEQSFQVIDYIFFIFLDYVRTFQKDVRSLPF